MLIKDIQTEIKYILWLQTRIKQLRNAVRNKTEFDGSSDFEMLGRKLGRYEEDYMETIDGLYEALIDI